MAGRARTPVEDYEKRMWRELHEQGYGIVFLARRFGRRHSVIQYHVDPDQREKALDRNWCRDHANRPKRNHHRGGRKSWN